MILKQRQVLVDARVRTDNTFPAGFMGKSSACVAGGSWLPPHGPARVDGQHRGAAAWNDGPCVATSMGPKSAAGGRVSSHSRLRTQPKSGLDTGDAMLLCGRGRSS